MSEKMGRVFVVGSVNMDLVIGSERQPKIGETIRGSGFFTNAGGKGANQAVAARRSGGISRRTLRSGAGSPHPPTPIGSVKKSTTTVSMGDRDPGTTHASARRACFAP